jgi:hypothetical protein
MFNVSQVCGSVAYCVVAVKRNSLRVPAPATATRDMAGRGAPRAAEPVCALRGPDWVVSGHTSTLVPLAAVGVVLLMVRATIVHLRRHGTVLGSSAMGDESRATRSSRVGPSPGSGRGLDSRRSTSAGSPTSWATSARIVSGMVELVVQVDVGRSASAAAVWTPHQMGGTMPKSDERVGRNSSPIEQDPARSARRTWDAEAEGVR